MKIYKIAQVAQKLGISKQTLVRYEKKGILPKSPRNHINSWRQYSDDDVRKMKVILRKGFTLVEMIMVLVIAGILAALVIPRFESFYSIKLDGGMKKIASDVRYCQQMAVSRHANCRIVFDTVADTYTAQEQLVTGGAWRAVKDPFTRGDLIMNFRTDPQYRGIDISSANFNSTNTLLFNWQGSPLAGGSAVFISRGNARTLIIANNTGRVIAQ